MGVSFVYPESWTALEMSGSPRDAYLDIFLGPEVGQIPPDVQSMSVAVLGPPADVGMKSGTFVDATRADLRSQLRLLQVPQVRIIRAGLTKRDGLRLVEVEFLEKPSSTLRLHAITFSSGKGPHQSSLATQVIGSINVLEDDWPHERVMVRAVLDSLRFSVPQIGDAAVSEP